MVVEVTLGEVLLTLPFFLPSPVLFSLLFVLSLPLLLLSWLLSLAVGIFVFVLLLVLLSTRLLLTSLPVLLIMILLLLFRTLLFFVPPILLLSTIPLSLKPLVPAATLGVFLS